MTKLIRIASPLVCFAPFDPDAFMATTVDAPVGDTKFPLVPEGDFQAMIGDFTSEAFEQIDFEYRRGPKAGSPGSMTKFNCPFTINDQRLVTEIGRDTATIFKQIILDLDAQGNPDFGKGKNVQLNQVRDAVGQNVAGPWTFSQLRGAGPVMVHVVHRSGKRKDGSDWKNAEVDRVVRIGS